ncbi:hypothetical protein ACJX0J_008788 [Zea mays]
MISYNFLNYLDILKIQESYKELAWVEIGDRKTTLLCHDNWDGINNKNIVSLLPSLQMQFFLIWHYNVHFLIWHSTMNEAHFLAIKSKFYISQSVVFFTVPFGHYLGTENSHHFLFILFFQISTFHGLFHEVLIITTIYILSYLLLESVL